MEPYNSDLVIFAEKLREKMQDYKPALIRQRRPMFRAYPDVFMGCEAVTWVVNNSELKKTSEKNNNGSTIGESDSSLTECDAIGLFQKLMDAGLLRNVQTMEGFQNDRSLYRFSSDDHDQEGDTFVRSVAFGYRLYKNACDSTSGLFQKVCAFGQLVSSESLKASDIVSWLVTNGLCKSREAAVEQCASMCSHKVIKSVDPEVSEFGDDKSFFVFLVDYTRKPIQVAQFLSGSTPSGPQCSSITRNKHIHLRQTSDQLMDLSLHNSALLSGRNSRHKGLSTSSDDSGIENGSISPPSYKSLLKSDGSMTKEALLHPSAPFVKKDLKIFPDPVGYGFVIRGSGPCYVKIVDPDSPAGKAGLMAKQYIVNINSQLVTNLPHPEIEDLILNGPKLLKITIMQHIKCERRKASEPTISPPVTPTTPGKTRSSPPLPSAQPWMKKRDSDSYRGMHATVMSRS